MEVVEVLEGSLQMLDERGWCKGGYTDEYDSVCMVRALYLTISEQVSWDNGGRLLLAASIKTLSEQTGMSNLAMWNDNPKRTYSQVHEVFRRAIAEQSMKEIHAA